MKKNIVIKKLDQDDILEIIIEHFYESELKDYPLARANILGQPDKDLRFVGVFAKEEHDEIFKYDLEDIDKTQEFNGDHAYFKKHPEALIKSEE